MRNIFGFIIILYTVTKLHANHNCTDLYLLFEESTFGDRIFIEPKYWNDVDLSLLDPSVPKACYLGLTCGGIATECDAILNEAPRYGPDIRVHEPVVSTSTTLKPTNYINAVEETESGEKCTRTIKEYLLANKCEEIRDINNESTSFYHCEAVPYEECDTFSGGHPSHLKSLTEVRKENCNSYIMHIKNIYNDGDLLPYPIPVVTENFERIECIDYSTTCILEFNCNNPESNCVNTYRFKPAELKIKNTTNCLNKKEPEIVTPILTHIVTNTSGDTSSKTTTEKPANTTPNSPIDKVTASNVTTVSPADITSNTTINTVMVTASNVTTPSPVDTTSNTTFNTVTVCASNVTTLSPADKTSNTTSDTTTVTVSNATTENPTVPTSNTTIFTARHVATESPADTDSITTTDTVRVSASNFTTESPATTTRKTTTTHAVASSDTTNEKTTSTTTGIVTTHTPTDLLSNDKTNTKNADITNSELYANDTLKGFVMNLLGNTSETNVIVYTVLVSIGIFVSGMLCCFAMTQLTRCKKKGKYEFK